MIPDETIHGPGDTIVTTIFARSKATQVFGKQFLRGKVTPEKHDQEKVKSCGELSLTFRCFRNSTPTHCFDGRSGGIHTVHEALRKNATGRAEI